MKIATHSQRFLHLQIRYENSQVPRIIADVNHFDCFSSIAHTAVCIESRYMYLRHHTTTRDEREFLSVFFFVCLFSIQLFFSRYRLCVLRMNANVERAILRRCVIACSIDIEVYVCLSKFQIHHAVALSQVFRSCMNHDYVISFFPSALNFSLTQRNNKLKF